MKRKYEKKSGGIERWAELGDGGKKEKPRKDSYKHT